MEVDGIQVSSPTTPGRGAKSTFTARSSSTSTLATMDPLSLLEVDDGSDLNPFMRSAEARNRVKKQSNVREQSLTQLRKHESKIKSKISILDTELRQQRSLENWDEEEIAKLEGDKQRLDDLLAGINAGIEQVEKDIAAHEEFVQPRHPGKCRRDEATSLATHIDKGYIAALNSAVQSCPEVSLEEALGNLQTYLQRFMRESKLSATREFASQDQEQFKATLEEYVEYITKDRPEGDKPFIRAYTGQRIPVYAAVSAQMVNTETRFADSKLSKPVRDCLPWQAMLGRELASLPPLGKTTLYRGIGHKFKNLGDVYGVGLEKILYEPKSTSVDKASAVEFAKRPNGTLFIMVCYRAVDITTYSEYAEEREAILPMFTRLTVTSIHRFADSYDEIHMEEIIDEEEADIVSD